MLPAMALLACWLLPAISCSRRPPDSEVVIYAAQDQVHAEPILQAFQKETGIRARAVYDSEAVKTVGLANRLLAERDHPQCDVFWGNEEMRTRQLAAARVFRETNGWSGFGYRSRRMVINTNFVPAQLAVPSSLLELTNESWRGKVALAFPQFGTTATHFHALRQFWGEVAWRNWCRALAANKPFIVDGNSVVVKLVARGEAWVGLTDSDDIAAGQSEGQPLAALPLGPEFLLIPNTVALIRAAPHPVAAQKLFEYLQRSDIAEILVKARALESVHGASDTKQPPPALKPDWEPLLRDVGLTTAELNQIFLR